MCGICGVVALDGDLPPSVRAALPAMTSRLKHRGPDGEGYLDQPWVGLGHRRLAIIDRAGGDQPISNEDGSIWIVFNGEVYNHRELRRTLTARGHRFRTVSDTEAIVHAYEEYGEACVEHLDGMFAFAVCDLRSREVLLARDRLGKKPLFYARFGNVLHFGSEIKALAASPLWRGDLDLSALEGYLSLGYFLAPHTAFHHVRKLEPGHTLRVKHGQLSTRRYWDIEQFDTDDRPAPALVEELDQRLAHAVESRLESEVPLGAFLSGGIDSGLVVSYMKQALPEPPLTASVGFAEAAHNELDAALLTAKRYDTRHLSAIVKPELREVFDPIVAAFDEPFADPSAIPTYYVSRMARQHVTVALTGDGGDESFGGYEFRYVPHALEAMARRLVPGAPGRAMATWLAARWPRSPHLPRALRLGNVLENLGGDAATAYYRDLCFVRPASARSLLGQPVSRDIADSPVFDAVTAPYRRCTSRDAVQRAMYADLHVYMPNDPLVKVDRMSMAHSLEIRCPLLDHHLVEFAFRIPMARKMPSLQSKFLLRQLANRRLPAAVASGPKRGFSVPIGQWIATTYASQFRDEVLGSSSRAADVFDRNRIQQLFDAHMSRTQDHWFALWAIWLFDRWAHSVADTWTQYVSPTAKPALVAATTVGQS